jgi:hypothetical protein
MALGRTSRDAALTGNFGDSHKVSEVTHDAAVSYRIDAGRRLVYVRVRENAPPEAVVRFYSSLFSSAEYTPGLSLVVDRRGLEPPAADVVRLVVQYLREHADQTGACRMAVVTDEDTPRGVWRSAEMLADHYTSVELRVFDDHETAEMWAAHGSQTPSEPDPS